MYTTVIELTRKSPADLEQTVGTLGALQAEVQPIPGFDTLYVSQTGEQALVMVTLYASKEAAEMLSAQVRIHSGAGHRTARLRASSPRHRRHRVTSLAAREPAGTWR